MEFFIFVFVALILVGLSMWAYEWYISKRKKQPKPAEEYEAAQPETQEYIEKCCEKGRKASFILKYCSPKKLMIVLGAGVVICVVMYIIYQSLGNGVDVPHDETTEIVEIQNEDRTVFFKLANGHVLSLHLSKPEDAINGTDGKSITINLGDTLTAWDSEEFIYESAQENDEFK